MTKSLRIVVAHEHPATREGIRLALPRPDFVICATADDVASAIDVVLRERPDLCLLSVTLPGGGIAAAREIHARIPEVAIVLLASSLEPIDLITAVHAGASGYLRPDADSSRLPDALLAVVRGEAAIPRALTMALMEALRAGGRRRVSHRDRSDVELTPRQWEVLELLRENRTTAEIANSLEVSPVTVRRHVSVIAAKLGVDDREAVLQLLVRHSSM